MYHITIINFHEYMSDVQLNHGVINSIYTIQATATFPASDMG